MDKKVLLENVNEFIDNGLIGFCNCYVDIIDVNFSNIFICFCILYYIFG